MADDLWDRNEAAGNVDPWAASASALQPKRRFTLVPVDHDPWAPIQSAPTLQGPGELEDPEAAAFTPRRGIAQPDPPTSDMGPQPGERWPEQHISQSGPGVFASPAGIAAIGTSMAHGLLVGLPEAEERLLKRGYHPGTNDTQSVDDAFAVGSLAGVGSVAGIQPKGSFGTFIGRRGAENMAQAGRPTALKALDMAERMDAKGIPEKSIRETTNALIVEEDARLGGVHKGEDGKWRIELDDSQARFRQAGPPKSRLGRELNYPDLYDAHPDLTQRRIDRHPGKGSYYFPDDDSFLIGQGEASRKGSMLHEVEHALAERNNLSPGASTADFADGGPAAHLRLPGETPYTAYRRTLGEQYANAVEQRMTYDAAKRRRMSPHDTLALQRRTVPGLDEPPIFLRKATPSPSASRKPANPDEGASAFEQAQEKGWEDLAQRGEVGQQSMWSEMGAHLNKPGQRGGGPGKAPSELWSRKANLALAQMHRRGEWPSDIATKMSDQFGKRYTEDQVASQLEALGLVGGNRKLPVSVVGEWQPDAVAILQGDRVKGMSAAQIAKLIEMETGQVTTKNAVIGKMHRLRQERARAELVEDLAKSGIKLKAGGIPVSSGDAEKRRKSWPFYDRVRFWGGYY